MNVLIKCYVTIPECPSCCDHFFCGSVLVFHPHEKVYKVVRVSGYNFVVKIFTLGCSENEWKVIPDPFSGPNEQPPDDMFCSSDPLSTNGQLILHWDVHSSQYVISFKICEERFRETYLPRYFQEETDTLMGMGDKRSFIDRICSTQIDVWVLEDFKRKVWNKRCSVLEELISYITRDVNALPRFKNLKPLCSIRNGEVLVFQHRNSPCWYLYEIKLRLLKKLSGMPRILICYYTRAAMSVGKMGKNFRLEKLSS